MLKRLPNPEAHKKFIVSFCNKSDIIVKFIPGLKVPFASLRHGRAIVGLKEPLITDLDNNQWDADALHETSHLLSELQFTYDALELVKSDLEKTILNVICDNMCERARHGQYKGRDRKIYLGNYEYVIENRDVIMNRRHPSISALYVVDFRERNTWQGFFPDLKGMEGADFYLPKIEALDIGKRIPEIMESQDKDELYGLVKLITDIAKEQPPEPEPEQEEQEDDDKSDDTDDTPDDTDSDGGSDDNNDSPEGEEEEDEEGGDGEGGGSEDNEPDDSEGDEEVSGEGDDQEPDDRDSEGEHDSDSEDGDSSNSSEDGGSSTGMVDGDDDTEGTDNTEESGDESGESGDSGDSEDSTDSGTPEDSDGTGSVASWDAIDEDEVDLADPDKQMLPKNHDNLQVEIRKDQYTPMANFRLVRTDTGMTRDWIRDEILMHADASTLTRGVQKYLKIMSRSNYEYGLERGRLHAKHLPRIFTQARKPKIFKQQTQHHLKTDTAVTMLLDCSTSMGTTKFSIAAASIVVVSDTLRDLNIVHEVLGFTEDRKLISIYEFKAYNEIIGRDRLLDRLSNSAVEKDFTPDAESIIYAANRLLLRKELNKILFVMCDGQPCGGFEGNGQWYLKQVCDIIEKSGDIELIGVGIQIDLVKHFYKNHVIVNDLKKDLEPKIIEALKKTLT